MAYDFPTDINSFFDVRKKPDASTGHALRRTSTEDPHLATLADWRGIDMVRAARVQEDFLASSTATLPSPWATQDTSAAGSPTLDYVDDADNGQFELTSDAQAEAQKLTLYWGDSLHCDVTTPWVFECRMKLNIDTALTGDDLFVAGVASARNATLDSVVTHAWIRAEGTVDLLWETDDGTTDDDDNDTGLDLTDDAFFKIRIDGTTLAAVKFWIDLEDGAGFQLVGTGDLSAATGNVQPFIELQVGDAELHSVVVDYADLAWVRN